MAGNAPLVRAETIPRFDLKPRAAISPNTVVVYATADGELEMLDAGKPLRWAGRQFSMYRTRYEVDTGAYHRTAELRTSPPPAAGGLHKFSVTVTVGYRVADAVAAVRNNIGDGLGFVYGYIAQNCRHVTIRYSIEDFLGAETAINQWFSGRHDVGGGIELFALSARVEPDASIDRHLRALETSYLSNREKAEQFKTDADDVKRDNSLKVIGKSGELALRDMEREAMQDRDMTPAELIRIHLERFPSDTGRAMEILADAERIAYERAIGREDRNREMIKYLVAQGIVRDIDMEPYREQLLGGGAPKPALAGAASWDAPLPGSGNASSSRPGVIPIYLVVDESAAVADVVDDLNRGLVRLYDALSARPDVARAVRISVVGYSDTVGHVVPLHEFIRDATPPRMSAAGSVRYAVAFKHLLNCIPSDAAALKAENPSVRRPQVLFLSGSRPDDEHEWAEAYRQLLGQAYAPDIMAFGVGGAQPGTIGAIATRSDYGFMATGSDPHTAIEDLFGFIRDHVINYGRAVLDGDSGLVVTPPRGIHQVINGTVVGDPAETR